MKSKEIDTNQVDSSRLSADMSPPIELTLVHGTFARNASWTKHDSSFRNSLLKTIGKSAIFHESKWSGKNLVSARIKGAMYLYESLCEQQSNSPETKKILVGHSHGGSVIAYALKKYPELSNILSGVVLLSTPIIDARKRAEWYHIYVIIVCILILPIVSILFMTFSVIASEYAYCMGIFCNPETSGDPDKLVFWTSIKWLSVFFGLIIFFLAVSPKTAKRILKIEKTISEVSTSEALRPNVLIVKSTGDEAYGLLSAVHIISWLTSKLLHISIRPITFFMASKIRAIVLLTISAIVLFGSAVAWSLATSPPDDFNIGENMSVRETLTSTNNSLFSLPITLDSIIEAFLIYVPFIIPIWCAALVVCIVFGFIANLLFGKLSLLISLFVEISVEPSPHGAYTLYRDSWNSSSRYSGLSHSTTYQSDDAISYIGDWIKQVD